MITIDTQKRRLVQKITNYNMGLLRLRSAENEYFLSVEKFNNLKNTLADKKAKLNETETKLAQRKLQIESCERLISELKLEKSRLDYMNFEKRADVDKRLASAYEVYYNFAKEYFSMEAQLKSLNHNIQTLVVEQNVQLPKLAQDEEFLIRMVGTLSSALYAIEVETGKPLGSEALQNSVARNNRGAIHYKKLEGVETITLSSENESENE